MSKVQIIKYACCGKVFAGCVEPECYLDEEWQADLRKYVQRGDKVEMIDSQDFKFEKCECKTNRKPATAGTWLKS